MPRLLFVVTEDWYFRSHRLPLARAAQAAGFDVWVATNVTVHREELESEGFTVIPFDLRRRRRNPFALAELGRMWSLIRLYRRLRPDIVHHVAMKPVAYGAFAAWIARVPVVLNMLAGLGHSFGEGGWGAKLRGSGVRIGLTFLLRRGNSCTVVMNPDDAAFLVRSRILPAERIVLIPGSGVDTQKFEQLPFPALGVPVAAIVSRMLRTKGIDVAVEALGIVRSRGISLELHLVGTPDETNPSSFTVAELEAWNRLPGVKWMGYVEDVRSIWAQASIAILAPRSREGLPLSLLEAAACGRPIITADVPGCREIVRQGSNGILVPSGDAEALADAMALMAADEDKRVRYGEASRLLAQAKFSAEHVSRRIIQLYQEMGRVS